MASGSIFFLIARLLTVMVSAFTDYGDMKGTLENSSLDTTPVHRQLGCRRSQSHSQHEEGLTRALGAASLFEAVLKGWLNSVLRVFLPYYCLHLLATSGKPLFKARTTYMEISRARQRWKLERRLAGREKRKASAIRLRFGF